MDVLNLVFLVWLFGLVTLPLWLYPVGRRGARVRERLEAPHRHPRPATSTSPSRLVRPWAPQRAFLDGLSASSGERPRRLDEIPRLLADRHEIIGDLEEQPAADVAYRVNLLELANGQRVPGGAVCAYDRGVVTGLFSALARTPVEVKETSCRARGAPWCTFDVHLPEGVQLHGRRRLLHAGAWALRLLRGPNAGGASARARTPRASAADQAVAQRPRRL